MALAKRRKEPKERRKPSEAHRAKPFRRWVIVRLHSSPAYNAWIGQAWG